MQDQLNIFLPSAIASLQLISHLDGSYTTAFACQQPSEVPCILDLLPSGTLSFFHDPRVREADPCDRVARKVGDICRSFLSYQSVHLPVPRLYARLLTTSDLIQLDSCLHPAYMAAPGREGE